MTPLAAIDLREIFEPLRVDRARAADSRFGSSRSMSTSSDARGWSSVLGASGMSALRPLPRAGRFSMCPAPALHVMAACLRRFVARALRGEREVRFGAAGARVVGHGGQAVAGRFGEAHVARDHRAVDLVLEELAHVARHLLAEVRALVVHRQQHAFDVERRVERRAHAPHRRDEIGEAFEREVLAVQRNQDAIGGDERVQRQQAERRRRVDDDEVEFVAQWREQIRRRRRSRSGMPINSISAPDRSRVAGMSDRPVEVVEG